jgi:endonuclease/exonuclease/phosphatase family metal-dependent hydrolase|tara:strand:+ start:149489 stop:150235 length:747 start_codon:yes stop_codon:yes gene_type:complete
MKAMTQTLRILTWNIQAAIGTARYSHYLTRAHHQVFNTSAKQSTLEKIAEIVSQHDVVCLQEVDLGGRRSGFTCQAERIAMLSGHNHVAKQRNRTIPGISLHGNAILSRYELSHIHDFKLPGRVKGRGCLIANVQVGQGISVANLHLSLGRNDQALQLEAIGQHLPHKKAFVVVGDFNCTNSSTQLESFAGSVGAQIADQPPMPTYPSWRPNRDLDHIIYSDAVRLDERRSLPLQLSDHLPLSAEISF